MLICDPPQNGQMFIGILVESPEIRGAQKSDQRIL